MSRIKRQQRRSIKPQKVGGPDRRWASQLVENRKGTKAIRRTIRAQKSAVDGRIPSWIRVQRERGPLPFQCWLCQAPLASPLAKSLAAHKSVCPRRQVQRQCGICLDLLPLTYPLMRKYHLGACDEEAERRTTERCQAGPSEVSWPVARIESHVIQPFYAGILPADVATANELTIGSLRRYVKNWRTRGLVIPWPRSPKWASARIHDIIQRLGPAPTPQILAATASAVGLREPTLKAYLSKWRGQGFLIPTLDRAPPLQYPYIRTGTTSDDELVVRVHRAVPMSLPESIRADVCQSLLLAILEGDLQLERIPEVLEEFVREAKNQLHPYAERSVETLSGTNGDGGGRPFWDRYQLVEVNADAEDSASPLHGSLECPICGNTFVVGTYAEKHDVCLTILEEQHRPLLRLARHKGRWVTRNRRTAWFLTHVNNLADPAWALRNEVFEMRQRAIRAVGDTAYCESCGQALPMASALRWHEGECTREAMRKGEPRSLIGGA